ncbi:hypothetical protein LIER_18608 [Lithospermum erythrorhizon]|uniref:Uncharacterized protein n=1 Tax=Lithospermum erythrorhizon TaxID=34254 RepID=A0AAV3QEL6_LITER
MSSDLEIKRHDCEDFGYANSSMKRPFSELSIVEQGLKIWDFSSRTGYYLAIFFLCNYSSWSMFLDPPLQMIDKSVGKQISKVNHIRKVHKVLAYTWRFDVKESRLDVIVYHSVINDRKRKLVDLGCADFKIGNRSNRKRIF